jgi:DNA-binding transcriptional LysR family regulator
MDKFQSLQLFVRVVENGSFTLTAKEASLSQATVSKQVSELERELKAKLLSRTTRKLHLTEAGEKFYQNAKLILEQYSHAVGEVRNLKQQPAGTLRLASSIIFGRKYITPMLPRFMERYPDIVIEHYLSDSLTDLVQEGIDLSIRIGEMKDSSYQARRIGLTKRVTVASKAFVNRHGMPAHPRDLEKLPCLIYLGSSNPYEWKYFDKSGEAIVVKVDGPYRVNVSEAMREAILAGIGIFQAPIWLLGEELDTGKFVRLLTDYDTRGIPISAVMPESNYVPQKTRAMINFLAEEFKSNPWLSDGEK